MKKGNVVILYGPMAAGKLTVAKLLSNKLGYKLSHNHLINDLAWSIHERDTVEGNRFIEELRLRFFEEVAKSGIDVVTTHAYAHDFVSMTGLSDPEYMKELEAIFEQYGTNAYFIQLKASKQKLLERIDHPSRSEFKKLTDKKVMENMLSNKDFETPAPVKGNITIDNSDLTPEETVSEILNTLGIVD